jgi:hypothetical protein
VIKPVLPALSGVVMLFVLAGGVGVGQPSDGHGVGVIVAVGVAAAVGHGPLQGVNVGVGVNVGQPEIGHNSNAPMSQAPAGRRTPR